MTEEAENYHRITQNTSRTSDRFAPALMGAVAGASIASVSVVATIGVAAYFARQVVVPPKRPYENLRVLSVGYSSAYPDDGEQPTSIRLPATSATRAHGKYGFYFDGGDSFALLGEVISYSPADESVTREVLSVASGKLDRATRGRLSGVVAPTPEDAGFEAEHISLDLDVGSAPAWLVHPQRQKTISSTWAIMVHGMGATRAETLRALDSVQALGMTSLHLSYRTDSEAPPADDGRYGLGFTEWVDVDTAIAYALDHGAKNVVLFGWSMGAAIALQAMDRARNRRSITALVLDGPAVDWLELIQYQTKLNKIPLRLGELGISMISKPALNFFTGLQKPIDLARLSWTRRVDDIRVPVLIMHSLDDSYVPAASGQKLAQESSLVDFVAFHGATHTGEWNVDPQLWFDTVTGWLPQYLSYGSNG